MSGFAARTSTADWAGGALDAQHRVARVMKEISIKLLGRDPSANVIAPMPSKHE